MNREEILNMEAGREMDALIHEKVLDYIGAYRYEGAFGHERERYINDSLPNYSTDIAAAWQVVGKIESEEFRLHKGDSDDDGLWTAIFGYSYGAFTDMVDEDDGWASAPTAPLAICRAALLAVHNE